MSPEQYLIDSILNGKGKQVPHENNLCLCWDASSVLETLALLEAPLEIACFYDCNATCPADFTKACMPHSMRPQLHDSQNLGNLSLCLQTAARPSCRESGVSIWTVQFVRGLCMSVLLPWPIVSEKVTMERFLAQVPFKVQVPFRPQSHLGAGPGLGLGPIWTQVPFSKSISSDMKCSSV